MQPLRFVPIVKRAIWGGTRLHTMLGKEILGWNDAAESWELCDLPQDVNEIRGGALVGKTLRDVLRERPEELLGRHAGCERFPLMFKFLDAQRDLSIQVHPVQPVLCEEGDLQPGKAEAWVVLDAKKGAKIYAGLRPNITEKELRTATMEGRVVECLQSFEPNLGDCVLLAPGTLHALGEGLLVAEIEQPSTVTYRLDDWGRLDQQGRPRTLHVEEALRHIAYSTQPIWANSEFSRSKAGAVSSIVTGPYFRVDRCIGPLCSVIPRDDRFHLLVAIAGASCLRGDGWPPEHLHLGQSILVPAERGAASIEIPEGGELLDCYLPEDFRVN